MSEKLPDGKVCNDCTHITRCQFLIGCSPTETRCDFDPSRFVLAERKTFTKPADPSLEEDDTCPDCDGSGELAGDYFSDDGMITCGRCNGRGIL